jgi:hypothetical protein
MEALKPWVEGTTPVGPLSLMDAAALMRSLRSPAGAAAAWPRADGARAARRTRADARGSSALAADGRTVGAAVDSEWGKIALILVRQGG